MPALLATVQPCGKRTHARDDARVRDGVVQVSCRPCKVGVVLEG